MCVILGTLLSANVSSTTVGDISNAPILSFLGAIIFYAFALAGFLSCSLSSVTFALYQRRVNKQKIGLVSLIISLI